MMKVKDCSGLKSLCPVTLSAPFSNNKPINQLNSLGRTLKNAAYHFFSSAAAVVVEVVRCQVVRSTCRCFIIIKKYVKVATTQQPRLDFLFLRESCKILVVVGRTD